MTYCLNPACTQPLNPDDADFCLSCGVKLIPLLRGRYRVMRPIGQGGFGRTYLAVDEDRLGTRCVIKQFSPQLKEGSKSLEKAMKLFDQEAVRLHELGEHPQIPALLAYFEQDSRLYLVQQFIEGQTLLQEMGLQGVFNEPKIRAVLAGILPTLKYVHDHQVIHRDITPSNIIRRKLDNKLVLIDFGVAKLMAAEGSAQPGTKIGTEGYAPIEQLRSGKAYPASDLYSLAATCLYLMTQTKPDDLYDPLEGRWLWREQLRHKGGAISEPIARILDKMLKDLVSERYQSSDDTMRDLRLALSRPMAGAAAGLSRSPAPRSSLTRPPSQPPAPPPSHPSAPRSGNLPTGTIAASPTGGATRRYLHTLTQSRWVMAVAISPDGQTLATGGLDDQIKLWDLATGELRQTLAGHTRAVNCLAFSPDGTLLISGSDDVTLRVWNWEAGRSLRTLTGHTRDVSAIAVHGDRLASGSEDRTARLWNLETGEALFTFPDLAGMIRSVALSPDGKTLACGKLDHQIKLWNTQTGSLVRTITRGHFNAVNTLLFGTDSNTLISGSKDKTIKVWDLASGEVVRALIGHTDSVNAIALSRDGTWLVSGSSDKTVRLWNLKTGALVNSFNEHSNGVNSVTISPDGRFAASGSSDNTVKIWQLG